MIGPACGIYGVRCSVKCFRVQSSGIWSFLWNGWGPTISELFLSLECSGIKLGSNWLSFRGVWSQRVLSFFVRCYMIGSVCHMNLYWSFHVWYHMVLERSFLWNNLGQRPHGWSCWWNVWASKVPVFSLECLGLERSWLALPWRVWTETYSFNPFSLEFLAVCVCPFSGTEKACHWFCLIEVPNFWCHTICHSLSLECLWSGFHLECLSVTVFGSYGLPFPWSVWGQKASNRSGHWSVPLVLFQCLRSDSTWLVLLLESFRIKHSMNSLFIACQSKIGHVSKLFGVLFLRAFGIKQSLTGPVNRVWDRMIRDQSCF